MFRYLSGPLIIASAAAAVRPNIVFILTDDQDIELGGTTPTPKIRELLGEQGAVGEAMYVNTPICCPSRTEFFSGRMYHNVLNPQLDGCMHVDHKKYIFETETSLVPMLQSAGYRTGGFGKIINGQNNIFGGEHPLTTGWDWLSVPEDEGDYFENTYFNKVDNGTHWMEVLGDPKDVVAEWYQTAQIGNRSIEFIRDSVDMGKPFFAYLGPHAPHYSADAPPWATDLFSDLHAPRGPAYNTSVGLEGKSLHVQQNPPITAEMEQWIDLHFRNRWRSLVGVDDMVGLVHAELLSLGILDNTYIFYTSDHGYKLGQWRLGCSKEHPYETDVHIPFFARGPGITPGTRLTALGSNIDVTPTFLEIVGIPPQDEHDGESLLPQLLSQNGSPERIAAEDGWRTSLIIEYLSVGTYYNNHAAIWVSGPAAEAGTPVEYGQGPFSPIPSFNEADCEASEGEGKCYFVDSEASNNWIGIRVRNSTHNFMYVESYGSQAMHTATPNGAGKGIFKCLDGDHCQLELYDYGEITSDYPNFPVMTDARWNMHNSHSSASDATKIALVSELKHHYCSTRKLDEDRMECDAPIGASAALVV